MADEGNGLIVTSKARPREGFEDPGRGDASWFTLFSKDLTPTERMCAGLMELEPGGVGLMPHRHDEPELYHVVGGSGIVTIGGIQTAVAEGSAAFIPGSAEHSLRNTGDTPLRVFYVFPTDRFTDVVYRFSEPPSNLVA